MATLAEVLRQAGYVTPQGQVTGPRTDLAQKLKSYVMNIPQNAAQNLANQRADIDAALTMGDKGIQIGDRAAFERQMAEVPNLGGVMKVSGAMRTAQKNAALPIEQGGLGLPPNNTPMDRARAMGFDLDVYHGTASDIKNIDPSKFGTVTGAKTAKNAFFVTDSPEVARTYAEYAATHYPVKKLIDEAEAAGNAGKWDLHDKLIMQAEDLEKQFYNQYGQGQNIMPFKVRSQELIPVDMGGKSFDDFGISDEIMTAIQSAKKDKVVEGVLLKNLNDAIGRANLVANHVAITNPAGIRSKFAAFDPKRRKEADILAGAVAVPLAADEDTRRNLLEKLFNEQQK